MTTPFVIFRVGIVIHCNYYCNQCVLVNTVPEIKIVRTMPYIEYNRVNQKRWPPIVDSYIVLRWWWWDDMCCCGGGGGWNVQYYRYL